MRKEPSKSQKRLWAYLERRITLWGSTCVNLGSKQIGEKIGMPDRTVRHALQELRRRGLIDLGTYRWTWEERTGIAYVIRKAQTPESCHTVHHRLEREVDRQERG